MLILRPTALLLGHRKPSGEFDSGVVGGGAAAVIEISQPGTYEFLLLHPDDRVNCCWRGVATRLFPDCLLLTAFGLAKIKVSVELTVACLQHFTRERSND